MPAAVTLTFETLDSRSVPVNVKLSGTTDDGYWYNVARTNPSVITVSGAASVVRDISQALVKTDVTGIQANLKAIFVDSVLNCHLKEGRYLIGSRIFCFSMVDGHLLV